MRRLALVVVGVFALVAPSPAGAHGPQTPANYFWVDAPDGVSSAGEARGATATYPADIFAVGYATAWTPDLQAVVSMSVPPGVEARSVDVSIEPVDLDTLAALPGDVSPNGNAYRVTVDGDGWAPHVGVQLSTPYPSTEMWTLDEDWSRADPAWLPSGEITTESDTTSFVAVAAWEPPTHSWYQRLAHRPALVIALCVLAGAAGWAIGKKTSPTMSKKQT